MRNPTNLMVIFKSEKTGEWQEEEINHFSIVYIYIHTHTHTHIDTQAHSYTHAFIYIYPNSLLQ